MRRSKEEDRKTMKAAQLREPAKTLPDPKATLTVAESARMLGIGKNQCYAAARKGELPVLHIGGRILISRAGLERMLNSEPAHRPPACVSSGSARKGVA